MCLETELDPRLWQVHQRRPPPAEIPKNQPWILVGIPTLAWNSVGVQEVAIDHTSLDKYLFQELRCCYDLKFYKQIRKPFQKLVPK